MGATPMLPFVEDVAPRNALAAAVYRAPAAPARVRRLGVPRPPEGSFAVTAQHIPGARVLSCAGYSLPVLAENRILYRGEPVVLFCGPDREVLAELLRAVTLEWEPEDAPAPRGPEPVLISRGDAAGAFAAAARIVEGQYRTPAALPYSPDPHGAVAEWSGRSLTVHCSTEDPFAVRRELARMLDIPERRVRVLAARSGDCLQGKLLPSVLVAAQAALLSLAANRPVKLLVDREQEALCAPRSPAFLIRHQTALGADGTPTGARVELEMSTGPIAPLHSAVLQEAARAAWGAYRLPNVEVAARWLPGSGVPGGSYRAAGAAPAYFAAELHASRLEEIAQLDPCAWKKRLLPDAGEGAAHGRGRPPRMAPAQAVFEEAVRASDFRRKHAAFLACKRRRRGLETGPLRGVGLAVASPDPEPEEPGRPPACLRVVLDKGRRLRVYSSLQDSSSGVQQILARRAAELLELETDRVEFVPVDTQGVPDTGPTSLDRALRVALPLLEHCCHAVARKSLRGALPVEARRSAPTGSRPRRAGEGRAWGAAVVEVEVDPVTLESECRGVWLAVAAGSVPEKDLARRTLAGQVIRALAFASRMPPSPEAGRPPPLLSPTVGQLQVLLLPGLDPPQGYERLPHLCVPAAYAAAVSQATGLYLDEIPVTPEAIQACLRQA